MERGDNVENPYYRTCDCLKEKENKDNTNSENNNDKDMNN